MKVSTILIEARRRWHQIGFIACLADNCCNRSNFHHIILSANSASARHPNRASCHQLHFYWCINMRIKINSSSWPYAVTRRCAGQQATGHQAKIAKISARQAQASSRSSTVYQYERSMAKFKGDHCAHRHFDMARVGNMYMSCGSISRRQKRLLA